MTSHRKRILLPWHAKKLEAAMVLRAIEVAGFARWLDADLNVLIAPKPSLAKLKKIESKMRSLLPADFHLTIEGDTADPVKATLAAVKSKDTWLTVLIAEPRKQRLSIWQRELAENIDIPLILVPTKAKLEPLDSILVPVHVSPPGRDSGLELGIQLATRLHLPLDLLHITPPAGGDHSLIGELSDSFHHDYKGQLDELIAKASPLSSLRDRKVIRRFLHIQGSTKREIVRNLSRYKRGMIALQWKGSFASGRAETLKAILRASPCPLLLIRPARQKRSTLQLGDTMIAA